MREKKRKNQALIMTFWSIRKFSEGKSSVEHVRNKYLTILNYSEFLSYSTMKEMLIWNRNVNYPKFNKQMEISSDGKLLI